ncbi:serine/threonine-protein phosphatase [Pseudenhygromyxa sp. WMMC2535]|uniref:PP2C family protein-serine/threonine phosphatase n=1 Tax=Pseudenhygromyxa sp. WMMC2535 TaxID=2712867 RepID=UPI001552B1FD|nr:protein phosphatase 2C domain-containing protein [Pseudenhygromyxa sp. WMMC2535]NVB40833.1 serine/threonine-protein phosphatase [Pseudenhygromyxa sp. WMMC2535]
MRVRYFGHSDVGKKRAHNEDAFLADPELGLFVVCDGVGGRARGEIASREAVDFIWDWIKREQSELDKRLEEIQGNRQAEAAAKLCQLMRGAIQNATYMVHSLGQFNPDQRGMSTTASAFYLCGNLGIVGQVGDSRVYLARDGNISQLTEDHTLVNYQLKHGLISPEEAKRSRVRNVITRAVGHKDYVEVDTLPVPLFPRDRILLCSDGLHGYLNDEALQRIMSRDVQEGVLEAIRFANDQGGSDNITALLIELLE